jgi:hypothetical protein
MVTVKRTWIKSQVSSHTDFLDIWDSGSHLYERWPDGTEIYWKIIKRKEVEGGIEEHLEKMPEWQAPSRVLHYEQVPLFHLQPLPGSQDLEKKLSEFLVGGWKVTQETYSLTKMSQREDKKKEQPVSKRHLEHHRSHKNKRFGGKQGPSPQNLREEEKV